MKSILALILITSIFPIFAQTTVKGKLTFQNSGKPVEFVSVLVKGTLDGGTTNDKGEFTLVTKAKGAQQLVVKGAEVDEQFFPINISGESMNVEYKIEKSKQIEEVVITAGNLEAKNDRAVAVLTPLDIVTTAGGQGDIAGAIQTLPGVQRNGGDQTGLMVRGGDVNESVIIIDGLVAQNAFNSSVPGVAQRTRFNPFQFKGTSFSTGGYSARFGQALSSVLDLSTNDLPEKTTLNIGANMAGIFFSGAKLMNKTSVEMNTYYQNVSPYFLLAQSNVDFYKAPQGFGIGGRMVHQTDTRGMFKTAFNQTYSNTGINIPNPAVAGSNIKFGIENENTYINSSYKERLGEKWTYFTGFSLSNNTDNIEWDIFKVYRDDKRVQGRLEFTNYTTNRIKIVMGTDIQRFAYTQRFDTLLGQFSEFMPAVYVESDIVLSSRFALKPGVRAEYSKLIDKGNVSPRLAMAFKTSKFSQVSIASGYFYQLAASNYLLQGYKPDFQEALHLMANYQVNAKDRIFRIEGYYKSYDQLVRENGVAFTPNAFRFDYGMVDNSGEGYAQGIDFFFRDKKSIKNFDYWFSYSFIDTKRIYQNYINKVQPDYVSTHNLNVVMKYFSMKLQTSFSATYSYTSGRPYYNPNTTDFLADRAPDFHNLSLTAAYLTTIKKMFTVLYLSIDNVTNQKNVLGYRYSADGSQRFEIQPPFYFNVFFGINLSLTEFNKDEL
ncbi:MAG: carboxypeptidase-like regulatory domain-containing protein [Fluviicola sp.]